MKKFAFWLYLALILAFIYLPILILVLYSFTGSTIIGKWTGFSLELYEQLFTGTRIRTTIVNTLFLALLAAGLSTVLGTVGAIGIFYNKKWLGKFVKSANHIPVINAEIVTAISLALVFAFLNIGRSYFALLMGHMVLCTPFVILSVIPKLKQMDGSLYEAALDLGASPFQALMKVVIPEILPGIVSGFLLAVTLSLDDYMISAYTKPTTFDTISTYVYSAVKNQKRSDLPALRALSAVIFFIMVIFVIVRNAFAAKKVKAKDNI